jgi:ammonia channel protein AmtB
MFDNSKRSYFIDLTVPVELFIILRGIIAGSVSVSISASNLLTWTAVLTGFIGGCIYIICNKLTYKMQLDDALHICTTHGATSLFSLFSICLFHKDEGFFFNDVYLRS